jgi:hypothetical protein
MTRNTPALLSVTLLALAFPRIATADCSPFLKDTGELLCLARGADCVWTATLVTVDGKEHPDTALLKSLPEDCTVTSGKLEELLRAHLAGRPVVAPASCVPGERGVCSLPTEQGEAKVSAKPSKNAITYAVSISGKTIKSETVKCRSCSGLAVSQFAYVKSPGTLFVRLRGLEGLSNGNRPPSEIYFHRTVQLATTGLPAIRNSEPALPMNLAILRAAEQFLISLTNKDTSKALERSSAPFVFWTSSRTKDCEGRVGDAAALQKKLACLVSSKVHARGEVSFLSILGKVAPEFNLHVVAGKNLYTGPAEQMEELQSLKRKALELEPGHSLVSGRAQVGEYNFEFVLLVEAGPGRQVVTGLLVDLELET